MIIVIVNTITVSKLLKTYQINSTSRNMYNLIDGDKIKLLFTELKQIYFESMT